MPSRIRFGVAKGVYIQFLESQDVPAFVQQHVDEVILSFVCFVAICAILAGGGALWCKTSNNASGGCTFCLIVCSCFPRGPCATMHIVQLGGTLGWWDVQGGLSIQPLLTASHLAVRTCSSELGVRLHL